ncbi:hypothetical protein NBM05_03755 [Rothia sp. AR01]|uniref:HNH endonuclease n=1 Tax=Rothia santali TaxID=2949643 RepID=A0A9X2HHV6_9MICC|nr:hypothetical protein [Rothia santali]MCP3425163.1 hypothetical protein [Rothia santali]
MIRAHRYSLAQTHGGLEAIAELEACHTCDNPICVRVDAHHVYLGTRVENMADRARRGRHNRQTAAQFWRYQSQQERAGMARALRDHVLAHGWDQSMIAHLLRGATTGQGQLF